MAGNRSRLSANKNC